MSVNRVSVPTQHRRESVQGDRGKVHYGENSGGYEFWEGGEEGKVFSSSSCSLFYL